MNKPTYVMYYGNINAFWFTQDHSAYVVCCLTEWVIPLGEL